MHGLLRAGVLDLDRDLAAVAPHRAVHLADARRRGGGVVELAEPVAPAARRTARRAPGGSGRPASAGRRSAAGSGPRGRARPARRARAASKTDSACPNFMAPPLSSPSTAKSCSAPRRATSAEISPASPPASRRPHPAAVRDANPRGSDARRAERWTDRRGISSDDTLPIVPRRVPGRRAQGARPGVGCASTPGCVTRARRVSVPRGEVELQAGRRRRPPPRGGRGRARRRGRRPRPPSGCPPSPAARELGRQPRPRRVGRGAQAVGAAQQGPRPGRTRGPTVPVPRARSPRGGVGGGRAAARRAPGRAASAPTSTARSGRRRVGSQTTTAGAARATASATATTAGRPTSVSRSPVPTSPAATVPRARTATRPTPARRQRHGDRRAQPPGAVDAHVGGRRRGARRRRAARRRRGPRRPRRPRRAHRPGRAPRRRRRRAARRPRGRGPAAASGGRQAGEGDRGGGVGPDLRGGGVAPEQDRAVVGVAGERDGSHGDLDARGGPSAPSPSVAHPWVSRRRTARGRGAPQCPAAAHGRRAARGRHGDRLGPGLDDPGRGEALGRGDAAPPGALGGPAPAGPDLRRRRPRGPRRPPGPRAPGRDRPGRALATPDVGALDPPDAHAVGLLHPGRRHDPDQRTPPRGARVGPRPRPRPRARAPARVQATARRSARSRPGTRAASGRSATSRACPRVRAWRSAARRTGRRRD